jgi:predicted ABC-type exoprotein transport system permease subunit
MRKLATAGSVLALLTDGLYLYVLHTQSATDNTLRAPFITALIATAAVIALLAQIARPRALQQLLWAFAAATLLIIGVLALFSIGALLMIAGALVGTALVRPPLLPGPLRIAATVIGVIAATVVSVVGLQMTSYMVSCAGIGDGSGTSTTFLGSSYSWTCSGGRLTVTAG